MTADISPAANTQNITSNVVDMPTTTAHVAPQPHAPQPAPTAQHPAPTHSNFKQAPTYIGDPRYDPKNRAQAPHTPPKPTAHGVTDAGQAPSPRVAGVQTAKPTPPSFSAPEFLDALDAFGKTNNVNGYAPTRVIGALMNQPEAQKFILDNAKIIDESHSSSNKIAYKPLDNAQQLFALLEADLTFNDTPKNSGFDNGAQMKEAIHHIVRKAVHTAALRKEPFNPVHILEGIVNASESKDNPMNVPVLETLHVDSALFKQIQRNTGHTELVNNSRQIAVNAARGA